MKFTMSKDGLHRATMRVEFRVDRGYLESATAELIVSRMLDDDNTPVAPTDAQLEYIAQDIAERLRPREIVDACRRELQRRGYSDCGLDDDWHEAAHAAAATRCRQLFPTAYRGIGAALVQRPA